MGNYPIGGFIDLVFNKINFWLLQNKNSIWQESL